jgi:putative ABC transport system permease protein
MNRELPTRRRIRLPGLHFPSILGRAWADRGPLLMTALVIALATLLATAVPLTMRSTADEAVKVAVARAGADAAVVVTAPFERTDDQPGMRLRPGLSAEIVDDSAISVQSLLTPDLAAVVRPPVSTVTSSALEISGHGPGRIIQLTYVTSKSGARAIWTAGGPPKSTVPAARATSAIRSDGQRWPVQVGLSQQTADELGVGPGDRIHALDPAKRDVEIQVSGIFRAADPNDPGWQVNPKLLQPVVGSDGTGTRIELVGMMSPESLPDGRLALADEDIKRTITFAPEPRLVRWQTAERLAATVVTLKATSGGIGDPDRSLTWESGLDAVLQDARVQVLAASAQASVLLVGLVTTAALVLLLGADLLVRRRAVVLAATRTRGASLTGIGAELAIESSIVTLAGATVGVLLGRVIAGGYSWPWLVPVILVAVLGGPVLGTRSAATATRGRQAPANRSARRAALRTGQLRRAALEAAVVLAATGAYVALRQRGVVATGPDIDGGSILPAVAPTLGAATGALVLLRLLPLGFQLALGRATRSQRSLPLFAAARAATSAARPLPFIALIMSTALLTFALAVSTTESDGQQLGAWRSVGADARLDLPADTSVAGLAQRLSTSSGVHQAVAARVTENVMVRADDNIVYLRLVAVDATAFGRLLATTPLPQARQLDRLKTTGATVPALLYSTDGTGHLPKKLVMQSDDTEIEMATVGTAPAVGSGAGSVLVVDADVFAAAGGEVAPNTVWVTGPRASEAVALAAPGAVVTLRTDVLAARKSAPLAAGLLRLANTSIGVLLLWGLLSVVLGAAASAPARGEMLARLRTLGLRPGESRRVAAGELLPSVVVGAVGGLTLGVLLAHASLGLLALRLLTGEATDPALVVPWSSGVPVLLLALAVLAVVGVESSMRRRERLGQLLRAGTSNPS